MGIQWAYNIFSTRHVLLCNDSTAPIQIDIYLNGIVNAENTIDRDKHLSHYYGD